ncbi:MAG TPA: hypothetical protein VGX76_06635 [Pirellulales bacterium]|nr:hypothetical protein [Pirellulales bacterium]
MARVGKRPIVLGILIAAHASLPLATSAIASWRSDDWIAKNAFRVATFGEAGLLAAWLGLAGAPSVWRLAAVGLGWAQCWWLLARVHPDDRPLNLAAFLLLPSVITAALALAIRATANRPLDRGASGWQFSVGQLLVFTTLVAVLIVAAQQVVKEAIGVNPLLVASEGSQVAVLTMIWAAVGRRLRIVQVAVAAVFSCAVGVIVQSYLGRSYFWIVVLDLRGASVGELWEDLLSIPAFTLLVSFLAAATIEIAARCGYPVLRPSHAIETAIGAAE